MQFLFEIIFYFFGEILIQITLELIGNFGLRFSSIDRDAEPLKRWQLVLAYTALGLIVGYISLSILPHAFLDHPWLRYANLLLTPLICGGIMTMLGRWKDRHDKERTSLEHFTYAYLFALSLATVRCFA